MLYQELEKIKWPDKDHAGTSSVSDETEAWGFWPQSLCFIYVAFFSKNVISAISPFLFLHIFRKAITQNSDYKVPDHSY